MTGHNERETVLEFPCEFPVKAMGRADRDFAVHVFEIVRRHVPELTDDQLRTAASRRGSFVSVTVTFIAQSQDQLDRIYLDLNGDKQVLMTL